MRVAIVTESFLPHVNGVTNSVLRVLEHLQEEGHEALIIAPESAGGVKEYRGFKVKNVPAIPVQSVLPVGMPFGLPTKRLEHLIDGFAPDVMHLASPLVLGGYAARIGKKLSIPTVSIYQTDIAGFAKHYGLTAAHSSLRKLVAKIHGATSRTLAPSTSALKELNELGVEDVYLWRRGVNSILFHPSSRSESLRNQWGGDKKLVVGYVGRLANEKRVNDLKVLDRDPRIQLVLVGTGPAEAKLKIELPNAIFTGFKSGNDLAMHYASFDLFVHPGPNETFCQAVQEALASGVPCIVPQTGGPADLVSHSFSGYIIPTHSPDSLMAAVNHYLKRPDKDDMRKRARTSIESRTWAHVNSQLINHYREAIARNSTRTGSAA